VSRSADAERAGCREHHHEAEQNLGDPLDRVEEAPTRPEEIVRDRGMLALSLSSSRFRTITRVRVWARQSSSSKDVPNIKSVLTHLVRVRLSLHLPSLNQCSDFLSPVDGFNFGIQFLCE